MPISLTAKAVGTPADIIAKVKAAGGLRLDEVANLATELYRLGPLAGINADAAVSQISEETDKFRSSIWQTRLNPSGIGVTGPLGGGGKDYGYSFKDGTQAAQVHLVHLAAYIFGACPDSLKPYQSLDPRWQAVFDAGYAGTCQTVDDLSNKWASDPAYGQKIAVHYAWLIGAPVATYSTSIPGLPGGPLETSFPVKLKILDKSMTLNRPGIKANQPRRSVQHGNGNADSSAAGEASYLNQGAPDNEGRPQQTSYHSAIDDKECWVMIPADEVTWQAADGAGPGNMCGFSCEQVEDAALWTDPARAKQCIANAAEWMGKISARLGIAKPEQHYDFNFNDPNRHDCPNKLRHTPGAWDSYVQQWNAAKAAELKRMGQPAPAPQPQIKWVNPSPIKGLPDYKDYQNDTVAALVTNEGGDFVFVGDVVEATDTFPRRQYASYDKGAEINVPINKGERFIVTWLFKSKAAGDYWYVTDSWTRVPQKLTKRVADAPLT